MPQRPQSALPKRSDADDEHDYAEKDRTDGVRAPLVLTEAAELEGGGLRRVCSAQRCGRGVQGWIRGHRDLFESVRREFFSDP